ncbi:helix-turn-helix domain-containing protein [Pseudonocardia ailaonensis]|uniref:Helix-turn-helix domain-containing protein n=1 Tax=Pseudonocardia ailaonensis TaxID=367279 RepID=A0ABN2MWF6_9PSEU
MDRRAALLDAGLQLWADTGWAAVTVPALCAASGLSADDVTAEFDSAEDLLCEVFDDGTEERAAEVLTAMEAAGTNRFAQIRAALEAVATCLDRDPRHAVVLVEAVGCPALRARRRAANRGFAAVIGAETLRLHNPPSPEEVSAAAQFCLGGLAELVLAWQDAGSPVDRELLVEHGAKLFEASLLAR